MKQARHLSDKTGPGKLTRSTIRLLILAAVLLPLSASCTTTPKEEPLSPSAEAESLVKKGLLSLAESDTESARECFAKALVHDPDCLKASYHLALIEEEAGNLEKALEYYLKIGTLPANGLFQDARRRYNSIRTSLVAKKIADEVRQLGERSIAVMDFTDAEGSPSYMGILFTQELTGALADLKEPDITIVERKRLKDIFAEKMLDETDLVDRRHAAEVKKFIPADILITGKVLEKTFVSVIEKDSGKVLMQDSSETFGGFSEEKIPESWKQLTQIRNRRPGFNVRLWSNKPRGEPYYEGDTVILHYTVDKPAFVFLYALNPNGTCDRLYPNQYARQEKIDAGKEYSFPSPEMPFEIVVEPPFGLQRVKMIACTKNVDPLNPGQETEENRPDNDTTMRNLRIRLTSENPTEWAETIIRFPITQKPSEK